MFDNTQQWLESAEILKIWLLEYVITFHLLVQLVIVTAGFVLAYYISRRVRSFLAQREDIPRWRRTLYRVLRRQAFPVSLIIWLHGAILIYSMMGEPHVALSKISSLVIAWALIRLASSFIDNPTISNTVALIIWAITATEILGYLPTAINWLESIKLGQGDNALTLYDLVSSGLSVAAFIWIALMVANSIERSIQNNRNLSVSTQALLSKIFKFTLLTVAFLIGLNIVGVDLTAFAVFGGAVGVGIGLGLQKVFSNLIAGIILLMDKSIKPGDTIVFNGRYGRVNRLSGRYVSMITRNGTEHLIPNDELINNQVENWSYSDTNVRLKIPVGVHYKSDVKKAMNLCLEAARETPRVLKHPQPVCLLKGFGDSSVDLEQRIWIKDPMSGCSNVKSEVLLKIWEKFHQHDIEIPYPQRDLHLRSVDTEAARQIADSPQS